MIIRIQGHNPSQIGKWDENNEIRNNIEDLVSLYILIGLLISSHVFSSSLVQNKYKSSCSDDSVKTFTMKNLCINM